MSERTVEIPWKLLGGYLEACRLVLEQGLKEIGSKDRVSYVEITCYLQPKGADKKPYAEYNVTWGEVGKRFRPDEDIIEEEGQIIIEAEEGVGDDEEPMPVDRVIAQKLQDIRQQLVAEILEVMRGRLAAELSGWGGADYGLIPGVRALITSPNPSDFCSGQRCEYDPARQGWFLRQYYICQGGRCCKRWTSTPC
jgi:hypothetical protein